jgi:hypothetical protein
MRIFRVTARVFCMQYQSVADNPHFYTAQLASHENLAV